MKKISILVAMMLVLTGGAFAQKVKKTMKKMESPERIEFYQPYYGGITALNDVLKLEPKIILSYNFTWQETEVVENTDGSTTTKEVTGRGSFACEVQDFDTGIFSGRTGRTFFVSADCVDKGMKELRAQHPSAAFQKWVLLDGLNQTAELYNEGDLTVEQEDGFYKYSIRQ